jgi:hypothetical protein
LLLGAQLGGILGALFAIPIVGILNVYLGALLRSRRGQEAFTLSGAQRGAAGLDDLPSLGQEMTIRADDERMVEEAATS